MKMYGVTCNAGKYELHIFRSRATLEQRHSYVEFVRTCSAKELRKYLFANDVPNVSDGHEKADFILYGVASEVYGHVTETV